jgi:hypothetical protein
MKKVVEFVLVRDYGLCLCLYLYLSAEMLLKLKCFLMISVFGILRDTEWWTKILGVQYCIYIFLCDRVIWWYFQLVATIMTCQLLMTLQRG